MTKEEFQDFQTVLDKLVDLAVDNNKISLPSDINKAAEEYAFTNWEDNDYHEGANEGVPFDPIGYTEKVFKAGAEWILNQLKKK